MNRRLAAAILLVLLALSLTACSGELNAEIQTTLGTFVVERVSFEDTYGDTMQAEAGGKILVVAMLPKGEFDQTMFKQAFCSDDGVNVAQAIIAGVSYPCVAVAVQGEPDAEASAIEYCLVFKVPASAEEAKGVFLQVPQYSQVLIKGKAE